MNNRLPFVMMATCALVVAPAASAQKSGAHYIVTATPIDVGLATHFCIAVNPADSQGIWWWEPGRNGCASRSTGPGVFPAENAEVYTDRGVTQVRFRVQLVGDPRDRGLIPALRIKIRDALGKRIVPLSYFYPSTTMTPPVVTADTGSLAVTISWALDGRRTGPSFGFSLPLRRKQSWSLFFLRNRPSFWSCMSCCDGSAAFALPSKLYRARIGRWPVADSLIVTWTSQEIGSGGRVCL